MIWFEHLFVVLAILVCFSYLLIACVVVSNARRNGDIERRKNICDMEGEELNEVGWHEEFEIISKPTEPEVAETCSREG